MVKVSRPTKTELKELYANQCEPCQLGFPECQGNLTKAEKWKCPRFFSGFIVIE